eukprot:m.96067 g.96067  ORF g.96067 m.96067 type:complete len:323 (+) comp12349_c0_seq2:152-1120(+)
MSGFHVPGHHVAAPPRSPQLSDAASFVATVKTQAPESYATFLDVLNQYQTGQLDVIAVQVRMELMFARHTHLVVGFREFLPENTERVSYWTVQTHRHLATEVKAWVLNLLLCAQRFFARSAQHASQAVRAVPPLSSALWRNILMGLKFSDFCWNTPPPRGKPQQKLKVSDALNYIDLVRTTFADDPSVYNSFLDAMRDFKQSLIDTPGVIRAVGVLFKGREDLISGFKIFLPPGWLMYPRWKRAYHGELSSKGKEFVVTVLLVARHNATVATTAQGKPLPYLPIEMWFTILEWVCQEDMEWGRPADVPMDVDVVPAPTAALQ